MGEGVSFRPVKTKRAFEEVCDQIRQAILSGRLEAGDKLPSERELATTLDVSRATIREAFRTLEIAGVLSLRKGVNGGAVVMQGDARPITQTISDLLSLGGHGRGVGAGSDKATRYDSGPACLPLALGTLVQRRAQAFAQAKRR